MTRGQGTGSQVLAGLVFKDGQNIVHDLVHSCVNLDTLDFVEEDYSHM